MTVSWDKCKRIFGEEELKCSAKIAGKLLCRNGKRDLPLLTLLERLIRRFARHIQVDFLAPEAV